MITLLINALQNNYPEDKIDAFGGKVCTFGSYRLGVHTKGKTTFKERKHFLTNYNTVCHNASDDKNCKI